MRNRIPLTATDMDALLALVEMQPATPKLFALQFDRKYFSTWDTLDRLRRRGLVCRYKARPRRRTDDEKYSLRPVNIPTGRLPYLYQLTPTGEAVAKGLAIAAGAFAGKPERRQANGAELRV